MANLEITLVSKRWTVTAGERKYEVYTWTSDSGKAHTVITSFAPYTKPSGKAAVDEEQVAEYDHFLFTDEDCRRKMEELLGQ
jgi:hypothetical protein